MEVAKIQAQQWLRFLTCYFALWLCNLCPVIPGGVPPAALRRRGWELRFLWPAALFRLSSRRPAARAALSRCGQHCRRRCRGRCERLVAAAGRGRVRGGVRGGVCGGVRSGIRGGVRGGVRGVLGLGVRLVLLDGIRLGRV